MGVELTPEALCTSIICLHGVVLSLKKHRDNLTFYLYLYLTSAPMSPKQVLPLQCPEKNFVCISYFPYSYYMTLPSHPSIKHFNNIS
jgi:hypothetical protein